MLVDGPYTAADAVDGKRLYHQYPTWHGGLSYDEGSFARPHAPPAPRLPRGGEHSASAASAYARSSPVKKGQKHVVFQLIDTEDPRIQARLPLRVMIATTDTTDSIITTVKNFYGLYDYGISFENKDGLGIIAAYDNFENDMNVYVRAIVQTSAVPREVKRDSVSPKKPSLGAPIEMRPPQHARTRSPSRNGARSNGVRSMSPQSESGKRSASTMPGTRLQPQRSKSKDNSIYGDAESYSSDDNGGGSVTSSRRSKTELVNAEISVDNIVEGGRRKGAFLSSELPLFVPPQVPMSTSISSISPQRRAGPPSAISPYAYSNQQTFAYTQPLPSPQSYGSSMYPSTSGPMGNGYSHVYQPPGRQLRGRGVPITYTAAQPRAAGVLPTPDPTVGSAISDEDVALQLMRLGDPMAFSHGRTSTSTVDDAFSGKADAASSEEDEDEDEEHNHPCAGVGSGYGAGPQRKKQRLNNELPSDATSGEDYEDRRDGTFAGSDDKQGDGQSYRRHSKIKNSKIRHSMPVPVKLGKSGGNTMIKPKSKSVDHAKVPMSPSSMPPPSRKASIASSISFQHQRAAGEDDLSSQPRCQRCRKSKKGCDRQRPCGRCKDAGIGIDGCISEDEANGRKGRYGRHMNVPVKAGEDGEVGMAAVASAKAPANGFFLAPALPDKSKKRKR